MCAYIPIGPNHIVLLSTLSNSPVSRLEHALRSTYKEPFLLSVNLLGCGDDKTLECRQAQATRQHPPSTKHLEALERGWRVIPHIPSIMEYVELKTPCDFVRFRTRRELSFQVIVLVNRCDVSGKAENPYIGRFISALSRWSSSNPKTKHNDMITQPRVVMELCHES